MPEPRLKRAGIVPGVGQGIAASVTQHVRERRIVGLHSNSAISENRNIKSGEVIDPSSVKLPSFAQSVRLAMKLPENRTMLLGFSRTALL
jgi:hypothetical protein